MIVTEQGNRFINELFSNETVTSDEVIKICDLGDTHLQLIKHDNQRVVTLDMPSVETLIKLGLNDHLKRVYPRANVETTGDKVIVKEDGQNSGEELSLLRLHCLGYPIMLCMQALQTGQSTPLYAIPLRRDQKGSIEYYWCQGHSDRITVFHGISFDDESDAVLGKVFLQELADSRKQTSLSGAPHVIVGKEAPQEIAAHNHKKGLTFITFVLFPRHFDTDQKCLSAISRLISFRDYFHGQIKLSKASLHTRMRAKVDESLSRLGQAQRIYAGQGEQQRKVISGKTFVPNK